MKRLLLVFALVCGVVALGGRITLAQSPVKVDLKDGKGASVGTATVGQPVAITAWTIDTNQ